MIPREGSSAIRQTPTPDDREFERWRQLGADGVLIGSVRKRGATVTVESRLVDPGTGQTVTSREYVGDARTRDSTDSRVLAHSIADDLHSEHRALAGIARSRIAFISSRVGERDRGAI